MDGILPPLMPPSLEPDFLLLRCHFNGYGDDTPDSNSRWSCSKENKTNKKKSEKDEKRKDWNPHNLTKAFKESHLEGNKWSFTTGDCNTFKKHNIIVKDEFPNPFKNLFLLSFSL